MEEVGTVEKLSIKQEPVDETTVTAVSPIRKERKRTQCINLAFGELRKCIPNVPTDTKLSKIKTLRLAISYIQYLTEVLGTDLEMEEMHKAKIIAYEIATKNDSMAKRKRIIKCKNEDKRQALMNRHCRTGWPQHVWALDLH